MDVQKRPSGITATENPAHLNAVFKQIAWHGEAFLLVQRLTEDDYLLKEEDTSLLHAGQKAAILIRNHESVLQEQSSLCYDFPLKIPNPHKTSHKLYNKDHINSSHNERFILSEAYFLNT